MDNRAIDVQILPEYCDSVNETWVQNLVSNTLFLANPNGESGVNVLITNSDTLHKLNLRFRGLNESTDVLSFAQESDDHPDIQFPVFPSEESLGDVVISFQHAKSQANTHNVTFEREIALLIVHGVLHLLGHDHVEPTETKAMQHLESLILDDFFASTKL